MELVHVDYANIFEKFAYCTTQIQLFWFENRKDLHLFKLKLLEMRIWKVCLLKNHNICI